MDILTRPDTATTGINGNGGIAPSRPTLAPGETRTPDSLTLAELLSDNLGDLTPYRLGRPQRSGAMTVIPVFGPQRDGVVAPKTGMKLERVHTYGDVEIANPSSEGIAIVPLHVGFIQHGAQNHALCRSALIGPGKSARFNDACCVQAAQGGFLEGRSEQWFFVLPLELRKRALGLRGKNGYNKLWDSIATVNRHHGLPARGHLEQIVTKQRADLNPFRSRFERTVGQVGALFLIGERLVGIEVAPTTAFFDDIWMPLVCFAYGVAALRAEKETKREEAALPFAGADSLADLRARLDESRRTRDREVTSYLMRSRPGRFSCKGEQRLGALCLSTVTGGAWEGQVVQDNEGRLIYASLFNSSE